MQLTVRLLLAVAHITLTFAFMIRFRKASANPFTASQFRIGEPNAISFSTSSTCTLTFKVDHVYLSNLLSVLSDQSRNKETSSSENSCGLCGRTGSTKMVSTVNLNLHSQKKSGTNDRSRCFVLVSSLYTCYVKLPSH